MSQQINLFNPALQQKREWLSASTLALGMAITLICVVLWGGWARSRLHRLEVESEPVSQQLKTTQDEMTSLAKMMADRKPDPRLAQELSHAEGTLLVRQAVAEMLDKGLGKRAVGFAEYLRGFSRQTTSGVWLTGFAVTADGSGMEIRGRTTDPSLLPAYIRRLSEETAFRGRSFAALQLQEGGLGATPSVAGLGAGQTSGQTSEQIAVARATARFHEFSLVPKPKEAETASAQGAAVRAMASGIEDGRRL